VEEIEELAVAFGNAAARAVDAGFDAVEVHGSHGFLLSQFQSPLKNRRKDEYGGSLEKRMKFPVEVVRRVRDEIGSDIQLWYRLGADDRMEGGNTIEDGARMAKILASEGVNVFDVSGGICGSRPPGMKGPGYFGYAASAVKKATNLPVVAVGGITSAKEAEEVLRMCNVDLVAVGRALLKDPLWGKKALDADE
jgi:2,4-dienoyl-CoA reductase-like NADH-dependent reductase (Old Yellow Enzyme family)